MKFTFEKKILAALLTCTVVLLIIAVFSFRNSEALVDTNAEVNHTYEVLSEFDKILISAVNAEGSVRGFIITGNPQYFEFYNNAQNESEEHIEQATQLTKDNPQQQRALEELRSLTQTHFDYLAKCIALKKISSDQVNALFETGESKKILDQIRKGIAQANAVKKKLLSERKQSSADDTNKFEVFFGLLLGSIMLAMGVGYFSLIANLTALRKAEQQASEKNWSLTGSSALIVDLQGNKSPQQLAATILQHLASFLEIPIGVLYIAERNESLSIIGAHGMNKKTTDFSSIRFGDGLAGVAAQEKRTNFLREVKMQHFNISTSFGHLRPQMIAAVPLLFENRVTGVLELGTLNDFTAKQLQYITFISGSLASALDAAMVRTQAQQLLEETQRQAEELSAQQEELKLSNEELQSKTELLQKSDVELKEQQVELQQINVELEEKANLLEQQKLNLETAKTEIEIKAQEIELSSKYKSDFLANMSHELRTPLNSILILSQLLTENRNQTLAGKDVEYAKNIHNAGSDLLNLINEILDLAKIEAGKMELDVSETQIHEIIQDIQSSFSALAQKNLIAFEIICSEKVAQVFLSTDKQRLEQILKNLLANAFKFTAQGGRATLTIAHSTQSGADEIVFAVADSGIGIPPEKLNVIFEAFQQADGSTKRKYGGTGLGLSISRQLALALGGFIDVQSVVGKGSTFSLRVPRIRAQNTGLTTSISNNHTEISISGQSHSSFNRIEAAAVSISDDDRNHILTTDRVILIIEDDLHFASLLLDFVRKRKYKGIIASQGNIGISLARQYKPDAIFLDLQLPVMDGLMVLRQIKSDPTLRHIPVQIISGRDEKKTGLALGAFDFIQKPVSVNDLQRLLDKLESFTNKKLKRLLIVEDDQVQNHAIRELIGNGDVKCSSAYNGEEAITLLEQDAYDCVIVDLVLPDMTGIQLLEKIKANNLLNKIPIVVYTGKELNKVEITALNKLADTVVLKTADSHERLLDETILFLHRVESKLPKEKQTIIRKLHRTDALLKGKKILLVDDDIRNIYSLTNFLEDEGVECFTAENGKVALQKLDEYPEIDMVLMDVMMPEMDGYEATAAIRQIEKFKALPILALTAKAMKGDKEKCLAAGMSDYISKPVNIEQLLSLMRVWLYK